MTQTIDTETVWNQVNPQYSEWEGEELLRDFLVSKAFTDIGELIHGSLVTLMGNLTPPPGTVFGLSKNELGSISVNLDTNQERMLACRLAGRFFAEAFEENPICIIQMIPVWVNSVDSEQRPSDDPCRSEAAMTIVTDLTPIYAANTLDEYLTSLRSSRSLLWQTRMHEGAVTEVEYSGALIQPTSQVDPDNEDTTKAFVDNFGLTEVIIGLSSRIPIINKIKDNQDMTDELDRRVKEKEDADSLQTT